MATLNYTGDGSGTGGPDPHWMKAQPVCFYRRLTVATIIAADATMTTNGYITIADVIQAIDIPIGFVFEKAMIRIITATTNACNCEVGLAGGAEAIASFDLDGTAGTCATTIETDSWSNGKVFYAADTIDVEIIMANATDGDFELFVFGWLCQLGA